MAPGAWPGPSLLLSLQGGPGRVNPSMGTALQLLWNIQGCFGVGRVNCRA